MIESLDISKIRIDSKKNYLRMRWKGGLIFCFSASVNLVMSGFAENRLLRRIDINLARSPKSDGPIQIIYFATAQRACEL